MSARRTLRRAWVVAGVLFTSWLYFGFQTVTTASAAADSDAQVEVLRAAETLQFRPVSVSHAAGLIFLPGGMVAPEAYAPLLRSIAGAGYPAYLVYLPMRVAFLESQMQEVFRCIEKLVASQPGTRWVLAGHSRGGMLASRFAHQGNPRLAGLALIGTTHPRDFSLASSSIPVVKIYGTRDRIATLSAMRENQHLLPASTRWVEIAGGNHVQFGHYRHQLGDGEATISREEQQTLVRRALLDVLSEADR